MISFDRLRRETDEISTKYNRGQKPVEKRGRPHGGSLCVPNVGHHRLVFEKIHEESNEERGRGGGGRSRCTTDSPSRSSVGRDKGCYIGIKYRSSLIDVEILSYFLFLMPKGDILIYKILMRNIYKRERTKIELKVEYITKIK